MPAEKKVLLVLNPISGDVDKNDFLFWVRSHAATDGYALFEFLTSGAADLEPLRRKIRTVRPQRVIAAGGDGTITLVAEAIQDLEGVVLGIVPLGSANGLAVSLGLPTDPQVAWETALTAPGQKIDGIRINRELCLHLSDMGFNALLIKNFEAGLTRGKLGYMREFLKTVKEHRLFRARITVGAQSLETETVIIIIANMEKYGTGFRINPQGLFNDGFFEVICIKSMNVGDLGKFLSGTLEEASGIVTIFKTREAVIEVTDTAVPFQIDGEYKGEALRLEAAIVPGFVTVALP